MFMPFPLANRECIMYGKGANRIYHNGTILVTAQSLSLQNDPSLTSWLEEVQRDPRRPEGLVEIKVHYYGFEISPISPNELSLRVVMMVDPRIPLIPDSMVNFASRKMGEDMIGKLLTLSRDFSGTQYEQRLKNTENKEFYNWIRGYVADYFDRKGWPYVLPTF